ncbi:hypothetical protein [Subdoligranulum variabile]|uniref:Uncharacterized protein n=1 Tax=Subdoligranulum variabile DSM 15176 TaxID=411471 RepID=D1PRA2_9FIRM|nr:hypothetical protein [Subdoligranulum variabile]EFB74804.1 hypothetical protein SUBVAR_06931 [Subdoligranulum variabile DSM 15176]UWP66972.1 hypothetical protein NQ490_08420 [Subdoligranulum variabile]
MEDNQLVQDLVEGILASVNASCLPLAVKALALENILLRVQAALRPANQETPQQPAE